MAFKVGDRVVYPHHGAAVITKKEKRKALERQERLGGEESDGDEAPQLVGGGDTNEALEFLRSLRARGVRVRVLTNGLASTDV